MNNRTIGIIITVATAVLCGCPGIFLVALGVLAATGSQMPSVMEQNPANTPQDVMLGAVMFLCFGAILILVPVAAGVITFFIKKSETPGEEISLPPAA
jgi:hypothetical protein